MKKIFLSVILGISILMLTSCSNFAYGTNPNANTSTTISQADDSLYIKICNDMDNVANTLRGLDVLYYENYCITELCPIVGYNSYQNQSTNYGINNNGIGTDLPASTINLSNYGVNYSYEPKYIVDSNSLDTTYLRAYMQSLQDLFLITNDITAGNEILNNLVYNVINEALNIKNNATITNMANISITAEQNNIFSECSIGIASLLTNLVNSSNFINAQLDSLITLRTNYHKNIEALNIKYLTILNIIDNRIVQIQNLKQILERLNNQIILIKNSSNITNNNYDYNTNYNTNNNNNNNNNNESITNNNDYNNIKNNTNTTNNRLNNNSFNNSNTINNNLTNDTINNNNSCCDNQANGNKSLANNTDLSNSGTSDNLNTNNIANDTVVNADIVEKNNEKTE